MEESGLVATTCACFAETVNKPGSMLSDMRRLTLAPLRPRPTGATGCSGSPTEPVLDVSSSADSTHGSGHHREPPADLGSHRARQTGRGLLLAGVVATLAATGCDREPARPRVRLTDEAAPSGAALPAGSPRVVRIGVASILTPQSTLLHYRRLIEYLGERLGVTTEMVQRPNYAEMNELMRNRYCLIGLLCNYAFVRAERDFGAEMLAVPVIDGRTDYQAYIIVARDSPYHSLEDLEGRRFAFADPLCNAGWLFPRYRLKQLGRAPDGFFGTDVFTYDYERSIHAVANGLVDAAGVEGPLYDSLASQRDPDALRTRIVDRSAPFGNPPVAVHPALDAEFRRRVREFFLTLQDSEQGRAVLSGILVERFVSPDLGLYVPVRRMAEALDQP